MIGSWNTLRSFLKLNLPVEERKEVNTMAEKKSTSLTIRISEELKEQLRQAAEAENRSISNLLEIIVRQALKK